MQGIAKHSIRYIRASDVAEKLFGLHLPTPSFMPESVSGYDRMSLGKYYERQVINIIAHNLNLQPDFNVNKRNIKKLAFICKNTAYYITGRTDARLYSTYSDGNNIYRYEYMLEVKNLISYSKSDFENEVPKFYIPQVMAYSFLYEKPVIFAAQCYDGYIIKAFEYDIDKIAQFIKQIQDIVCNQNKDSS